MSGNNIIQFSQHSCGAPPQEPRIPCTKYMIQALHEETKLAKLTEAASSGQQLFRIQDN